MSNRPGKRIGLKHGKGEAVLPSVGTQLLTTLASAAILLLGCGETPSPGEQKLVSRPAASSKNGSLKSWSFTLNDVPFEEGPHSLGRTLQMKGKVVPNPGGIPLRTIPRMVVALRPAGSASDEDWENSGEYMKLDIWADIYNGSEVDDRKITLREKTYPAGIYDARLYFQVWDFAGNNSKSKTEYLAKSTITITDSE